MAAAQGDKNAKSVTFCHPHPRPGATGGDVPDFAGENGNGLIVIGLAAPRPGLLRDGSANEPGRERFTAELGRLSRGRLHERGGSAAESTGSRNVRAS
jgi:hypothetical protein